VARYIIVQRHDQSPDTMPNLLDPTSDYDRDGDDGTWRRRGWDLEYSLMSDVADADCVISTLQGAARPPGRHRVQKPRAGIPHRLPNYLANYSSMDQVVSAGDPLGSAVYRQQPVRLRRRP